MGNTIEPELQRLLGLVRADRQSPAYTLYNGLPAYLHTAVLAALSDDLADARRLHRIYVRLGVLSPATYTTRGGRTVRVQFINGERLAAVLSAGRSDAGVALTPNATTMTPEEAA